MCPYLVKTGPYLTKLWLCKAEKCIFYNFENDDAKFYDGSEIPYLRKSNISPW
jgi:hypothetical protein